jgi:prepilin-type N-terminal cleavage/methylation domain-containing protein
VFSITLIKNSQKGFTLFELMVAVILAGIMMTGVTLIYTQFMDLWDQDNISLEAQRQGTYALGVMEKAIKSSVKCIPGNYENDKYHKITATILVVDKVNGGTSTKDIEYYLDNITPPITIKEKDIKTSAETSICPDTYIKDGNPKSDVEVEDLTFASGNSDSTFSSVRIDLKLQDTNNDPTKRQPPCYFTTTVRLRNENVN